MLPKFRAARFAQEKQKRRGDRAVAFMQENILTIEIFWNQRIELVIFARLLKPNDLAKLLLIIPDVLADLLSDSSRRSLFINPFQRSIFEQQRFDNSRAQDETTGDDDSDVDERNGTSLFAVQVVVVLRVHREKHCFF